MAVRPSLTAGCSRAKSDATAAMLAWACALVVPCLNRPTPRNAALLRSLNAARIWLGSNCSAIAAGIHKSGPKIAFTPMNCGGAMPITVKITPLSRRVLPTVSLAPPKRACQVP